ncbi:hypothetical protein ILUMI_21407 [Ignelater luminosus]|uniref:Myb/SANT-like DNA-binding domain-containing protein n=1 Tax=Ignelater luminosus TaxID=2038154 RepID=A0A8K0CGC9_IGNLU|nr:hypothetical protein ILUMI_21407 [Ignelater luminosus]
MYSVPFEKSHKSLRNPKSCFPLFPHGPASDQKRQAIIDECRTLTIFDPETRKSYELVVSTTDYIKATTDSYFASSLLFHEQATRPSTSTTSAEDDHKVNVNESVGSEINLGNESVGGEINVDNDTERESTKLTYIWKYDQVKALISSMSNHIQDLDNPKKRKDVYDNVANNLVSNKYQVSATIVQNKWKNLLKNYRKAKDTKTRTG